ncbi:MFS transporter [Flavobacterium davisii]
MNSILKDFKTLPREVWFFFFMILINRMGAMVVPFMSKYLYDDLKFGYAEIGTIMMCFGAGSIVGTFLVGKISKNISSYKLMTYSMFFNGVILFSLQFVKGFYPLCFTVFILNVVADMFRPSMMATLKDFVKKEDRIKAFSLMRTASNFGFIISPIIAGISIATVGYYLLFYIDGISSIVAVVFFITFVKEKKLLHQLTFSNLNEEKFVFLKDKLLLIHCLITIITGIIFFQIFSVLPLYYSDVLKLSTTFNTYTLVFYGLVLFFLEVAVVSYIKKKEIKTLNAILYGLLSMCLGYFILVALQQTIGVFLALSFISFGVMLTFPFAADFVLERSYKKMEAKFLSYFQMCYGIAQFLSAKLSLFIIHRLGYNINFILNIFLGITGVLLSYILINLVTKEIKDKKAAILNSFFK